MTIGDQPAPERHDLASLIADLEQFESIFAAWEQTSRDIVAGYRQALDALNGEALRRLIRSLRGDPAAMAALKQAAGDEVVYAVLRHHDIVRPSLNERVEVALAGLRPSLAAHGGDVELVAFAPPRVEIRFIGACNGCAASALTFQAGVKRALQDACPEITEIVQAKGADAATGALFISPFATDGDGAWHAAGMMAELPDGGVRAWLLDAEPVLLARNGTAITAFRNACAHCGCALDGGTIEAGSITCAAQGLRYDLRNGQCLTAPTLRLHAHAVRVADGRVEVRLLR